MSVRCRASMSFSGGPAPSTPVASGGAGSIGVGSCNCIPRGSIPTELPACIDVVETGSQLLGDPGFENWDSLHGRTEFPRRVQGDLKWDDDSLAAAWEYGGNVSPLYYHAQSGTNAANEDSPWVLSTANPDSGTYHARMIMDSGSATLRPNVYMHCIEAVDDPVLVKEHVWPTTPGLTVDFSCRAMTPSLTNGQPIIRLFIHGWEADMNPNNMIFIGGFPIEDDLTTGYQTYSRSEVVPSGIAFLQLVVQIQVVQLPAPTGDLTIDVDNLVFGQE